MSDKSGYRPVTRQMSSQDDLYSYLDEKFEELKKSLVAEVKNEMKEEVREIKSLLNAKEQEITELKSTVAMLQKHVSNLKHSYENKHDDLEQYGRRLCLRVKEGIPTVENEKSNQVFYHS